MALANGMHLDDALEAWYLRRSIWLLYKFFNNFNAEKLIIVGTDWLLHCTVHTDVTIDVDGVRFTDEQSIGWSYF